MPTIINTKRLTDVRMQAIAAVGAVAAGVATVTVFQRDAVVLSVYPRPTDPARLGVAASYPDLADFRERARKALALAPLEQRALNAWYVYQVTQKVPMAQQMATATQLERLGWRDNGAQFNLIYDKVARGNLRGALPRVDALLRRNVAPRQTLEVLWIIEQSGVVRDGVRRMLAPDPVWRTTFLRAGAGLRTPAMVEARTATIADLRAHGVPVSSAEIAPVVRMLIAQDQINRAYVLWRETRRDAGVPRQGLYDPTFVAAAQAVADGDDADGIPFEWTADNNREATVSFGGRAESGTGEVKIRWSGIGVPTFLRQTFRAEPGTRYALRITGFDAKPTLLSKLRFSARCPDATAQFILPVGTNPSELVLAADKAITCQYPVFRVIANVDDVQGRFDLDLSRLELRPLAR